MFRLEERADRQKGSTALRKQTSAVFNNALIFSNKILFFSYHGSLEQLSVRIDLHIENYCNVLKH